MRKTLIGALMSALVVLMLGSCASFPTPRNATDTLLIIPVKFTMQGSAQQWVYSYALQFYGLSQPIMVRPTGKRYVAVSGLPAGRYPMTGVDLVPISSSNWANDPRTIHHGAPKVLIVLREGKATMAPFLIESSMEEVKARWFQQNYNWKDLTSEDVSLLRDELRKEGNFGAWEDQLEQ